jgi:DNA primase large subunit
VVKYGETEWARKKLFTPEERILINPLDPVYKKLLERAEYDEKEVLSEIEKRLEGTDSLYNKPEEEVLYQLFPLVAVARKGSRSREANLVMNMILAAVRGRLLYALDNQVIERDIIDAMREIVKIRFLGALEIEIPREDVFRMKSGDEKPRYAVHWTALADYDLSGYYIIRGWTPLTTAQLIEVYLLVLEKVIRTYIDNKRREYASQNVQLPPFFLKLLQLFSSRVPAVSIRPVGAAEFDEEAFPPCVREALDGTSSGLRNYAVTVLLTAFLSYARVYPSLTAFDQEKKPELTTEQIDIILEEVAPLIIEAGARCDPPLFTDQPIERANVFYHLGFGLTESPQHTDFGSSKWYLPPSCKKIQQNAPSLCKPDSLCLQGVYIVAEKQKLEDLISTSRGESQEVLLALRRTRDPRRIADLSGVDIGEVKRILRRLQKEGILIQIRVKNPLVYYVRKVRRKRKRKK